MDNMESKRVHLYRAIDIGALPGHLRDQYTAGETVKVCYNKDVCYNGNHCFIIDPEGNIVPILPSQYTELNGNGKRKKTPSRSRK